MPNCFTMTRKGEDKPTTFVQIDEDLCAHLKVECHPKNYYRGWYDSIGLGLAYGKSFTDMMELCKDDPDTLEILAYFEANYVSDAWAEIGRR